MADSEKKNFKYIQTEANEIPTAAELTENDDIVDYIQPSSLEILKARYAAVEEDEQIRNEGFEPIKKGGLLRKQRPEASAFGYYSSPTNPKDEIRTDVNSPLSKVFDETKTEFDADTVSFSDIDIEDFKEEDDSTNESASVIKNIPVKSYAQELKGFDTHTRVIYLDESADDGIKRNTDNELDAAFQTDDTQKRRRRAPWQAKRK